jgi:hypothetical protein
MPASALKGATRGSNTAAVKGERHQLSAKHVRAVCSTRTFLCGAQNVQHGVREQQHRVCVAGVSVSHWCFLPIFNAPGTS